MDEGRVLLVNPNQMKPAVAPLGLDYLASALKQNDVPVDLLDLCFEGDADTAIAHYFAQNQPLAVAVTLRNTDDVCFSTRDFFLPRFKEVIDQIKGHTSAPIVLGGSGFSTVPEAVMSFCHVDLGIWGEGEYSLPRLVTQIKEGEGYEKVPGLLWRDEKGVHRNPAHYLDLENSTPLRGTIDNKRYFAEGGMGGVETKRGCPKDCIYCADPLGKGRRLRLRSPSSVVEEMESLLEMGIDHLHFCDSEFNIPEHHCRELCLQMVERGLGERARWYTYASPVPFSDELATLWQRAGCIGVNFGVDAGCDHMLRTLTREFTVADLAKTAEICHRQGLVFMYDLLLGGPGETRESLRETVEMMKRLAPHRVGVGLGIRLFPGTKLAALVHGDGPLTSNPNLHGVVEDNDNLFHPIYYLSAALDGKASQYLSQFIGGDERFFFMSEGQADRNYNYNENSILVNAIRAGYRGAFWDILRRLAGDGTKTT